MYLTILQKNNFYQLPPNVQLFKNVRIRTIKISIFVLIVKPNVCSSQSHNLAIIENRLDKYYITSYFMKLITY